MNNVQLMGRLTADPKVTQTGNQMTIARYTLAVDRPKKSGEEKVTDFINCVAFGKNGEFAEKYLKKGTLIIVQGSIQTGSYTNKDGNKVYTTDVAVSGHEFIPGTKGNNSGNNDQSGQTANDNTDAPAQESGFMDVPDDEELPFN